MAGITVTARTPLAPFRVGNRLIEHYTLTNGIPTIAAGPGGGQSGGSNTGVVSILGLGGTANPTDVAGQIQIITGATTLAASGTLLTVTYANTMQGTAHPTIWPANATAQAVAAASQVAVTGGSTSFSLLTGATTLTASSTYIWNYDVADAFTTVAITTLWLRQPDFVDTSLPVNSQTFTTSTATIGIQPGFSTGVLEISGIS